MIDYEYDGEDEWLDDEYDDDYYDDEYDEDDHLMYEGWDESDYYENF